MKVYLGADHKGFKLKSEVATWLFKWGYSFTDMGADYLDPNDDYTKYASEVASLVSRSSFVKASADKGILICGSGVGVEVVANKFDGVRASIGKSPEQVRAGRNDDDMNVLVIASDYTSEDEAQKMVKIFLETRFMSNARHKRRLEEIKKIEANN